MTAQHDGGGPAEVRLAVIGAGPHALTLLGELWRADRSLLEDTLVLDPSGGWLETWCDMFRRLEIQYLRSPIVHHPFPDVHAIHRHEDLCRDDVGPGPYARPSQRIFMTVVHDLLQEMGAAAAVQPNAVVRLEPSERSTVLVLDDGTELRARTVVLATNAHRPVTLRGMEHAQRVPDLGDIGDGEHVVVVGGGLTAAQLVDRALEHGARVTMVTRRQLVAREFDVDPGWMGPKHLAGFDRVPDRAERVRRALEARGGGTVPPLVLEDLRSRAGSGAVRLVEGVAAASVSGSDGSWCVDLVDGEQLHADRVVAALGSRLEVRDDPLLGRLVDSGRVRVDGSVPRLDDALRVFGSQVHVMGRHAIAELGPAAGNLSGARRAAERIRAHLCGSDPRSADRGLA